MKFLIKNAKITDKHSSFNQQIVDVLIDHEHISAIAPHIEDAEATTISFENLHLSPGWADLKADFCEPGYEHKETLESGLQVAAASGYTHVALVPSTKPVVDHKAQVEFILRRSESQITRAHVLGAVTLGLEGEQLAEMYDMKQSGASYFTDDLHSLNTGILYRALMYTKDFGAKIAVFPRDKHLSKNAQVHEGHASTVTGLKADPSIAEIIDLEKYLHLADYSQGHIHITGISTAESVEMIRVAKAKGIHVTAEVHAEQLLYTEAAVSNFDVNYKLLPVLRATTDQTALWEGIKDGTIDGIASNHRPADTEEKFLEFDGANFGNITLQTAFPMLFEKYQDLDTILEVLTERNKNILGIEYSAIEVGNKADLTLFDPNKKWIFNSASNYSQSTNSPCWEKELTGFVYGVFNQAKALIKE